MPEEIVLVTGISGFIASHVAKVLLENGYRVKGTVRSLKNTATVDALKNLNPEASHSLELVEADLTADDGWDQAMEGCSVVMHIASPFPEVGEVTMKEEDVVVPAKEGTLRVMKAVVKAKIKKVVLTSSMASVVNCEDDSKPFTEEDWANPDSPAIDSYAKSKVLAEKAVWDFQKELSVILVTGVRGYIGSHVVKVLLENGYQVKGTVRSLKNTSQVESLKNLFPGAQNSFQLVEADLTADEGWDQAMEGCSAVMHVASPVPEIGPGLPVPVESEIMTPAVEGTLRVMKAAVRFGIKKVILTSSIAAIANFACDERNSKNEKVFTEEDWSYLDNPLIDVYSKSKHLAEKTVWEYLKELKDEEKFDLVVINPAVTLGPVLLESQKRASSVLLMLHLLKREYPALPRVSLNICDVRDVAMAHLKALTVNEAIGNRHIIVTNNMSMWFKDFASMVAKEFASQGYSVPTRQVPDILMRLAGIFNKPIRDFILPAMGVTFKFDNTRMVEVLGIKATPLETTIRDMGNSMIDLGILWKKN